MRCLFRPLLAPLAVALAVSMAAAPVVSAVHAEEHAHRWCAEHQALEEAKPSEGSKLAGGTRALSEAPRWAEAATQSEPHVSCALHFALLRDSVVPPSPGAAWMVSSSLEGASPRPFSALRIQRLLFVAPKASPPVAG